MVNIIILLPNGHIQDQNVKCKSADIQKSIEKLITDKYISSYIVNKGKGKIKKITSWKIDDNQLFAFGYTSGTELNNHELPPSDFNKECYGDILMIKTNSKKQILTLSSDDYQDIYTSLFNSVEESDEEDNDNGDENYSDEENYESQQEEDDDSEKEMGEQDFSESDEESDEEEQDNDLDFTDNENDNEISELVLQQDDIVKIKNEIRLKNINILNDIINNNELTNTIETSIYNFTCETSKNRKTPIRWDNPMFKKIYLNKSRSLFSNLKQNSYIKNTNLINNINDSNFDIENIAFMNSQQLFPEHWKKMLDAKYKKDKFTYDSKPEAMTDQFKCGRCKKRECSYYEMQTRSADEGMTIFITCINCGNRWKQ